jgi:hypothetical protein
MYLCISSDNSKVLEGKFDIFSLLFRCVIFKLYLYSVEHNYVPSEAKISLNQY